MELVITQAAHADADTRALIGREAFRHAYAGAYPEPGSLDAALDALVSPAAWASVLRSPHRSSWIVRGDGEPAGLLVLEHPSRDGSRGPASWRAGANPRAVASGRQTAPALQPHRRAGHHDAATCRHLHEDVARPPHVLALPDAKPPRRRFPRRRFVQ